ncbi:MAG: aminopeptidase C [Bacteroidota bacterium]
MKHFAILLILFIVSFACMNAQNSTAITPALLDELDRSCVIDAQLKTAQHALAQVDGNKISQNWEKIIGIDPYFSKRLKDQKITDQKSTGRCWMFSGLNIIRPVVSSKLNGADIELSQNYLYFYEKLEKANLFLDAIIKTKEKPYTDQTIEYLFKQNAQDGQNWLGFIALVKKYGVVPKDVMPETYSSSNSGHVNYILALKLKQAGVKIRHESSAEAIANIRTQALKDVYRILVINFGQPPKKFDWRYEDKDKKVSPLKTYTPKEFYQEIVGDVLDDYYALYSIPTLAFNKKYEIDLDKTVNDQPNMTFVNCPLDMLKDLSKKSLLDSNAVWFGCDVGQQSSTENGLMTPRLYDYQSLYGMDFTLSREELFETYSSIPTHNMVFTGIDIVDGKVKKWLVENSWGENKGKKGYLYMLDDWFDNYVQVVVLNKKYIPKDILVIFKTDAEILPPWDPMMKTINME